jgi:hypothetical protein
MRIVREHSLKAVLLLALVSAAAMLPWYPEAAEAEAVVNPAAAYTASTRTLQKQQTAPVVGTKPVAAPVQKTARRYRHRLRRQQRLRHRSRPRRPAKAGQVAAAKAQRLCRPALCRSPLKNMASARDYDHGAKNCGRTCCRIWASATSPVPCIPCPATPVTSGMVIHIVGKLRNF